MRYGLGWIRSAVSLHCIMIEDHIGELRTAEVVSQHPVVCHYTPMMSFCTHKSNNMNQSLDLTFLANHQMLSLNSLLKKPAWSNDPIHYVLTSCVIMVVFSAHISDKII